MIRKTLASLSFLAVASVTGAAANGQQQAAPTPTPEAELPFEVEQVVQLDNPANMAFLPDGSALITEKPGKLKLFKNGKVTDVAGVPTVAQAVQGGLLDVAPAPDFARSHLVYLSYSEPHGGDGNSSLALARGKFTGSALTGVTVLWRAGSDGKGGQFGATIAFAPDGKSLFLASGERMRFTPAQDPNSKLGKIVHLTLDGKPAPGNPWAGKLGTPTVQVTDPPKDSEAAKTAPTRTEKVEGPNTAPAETWSLGHRNPYGLAFAPDGRLWEVEFGPRGGDELNLILKGKNYGWPVVSEGENYDGVPIQKPKAGDGFEQAKLFWVPSSAPAGLIIYSGKMFPQWKGSALFGGLAGMSLYRATLHGDRAEKADRWVLGKRIRDVAEGPDGSIWLLQDGKDGWLLHLTKK